jgi:hypothetical protein
MLRLDKAMKQQMKKNRDVFDPDKVQNGIINHLA